ncbi:Single-stranded DNA-binding protein [Jiangella alkaliphila]|uniref:Single-stranded DNA-binding protein n=1 Tax=Jiangella alkaliphila TaxID=419479 RepID=A0A1H2GC67_9ACTN|nr:Single-stranded DNA-binding protein [Jiangella alkaliphila]
MGNSFPMSATGRVMRIPEQVTTRSGAPMAKFTIAVQDFARQPDGSWVPRQVVNHDVVAFGMAAQAVAALRLEAGDPVIVVGDLVFNAYQTRDGVRASCEIRARAVALDASADGVTISRNAAKSVEHASATAGAVPPAAASGAPPAKSAGEEFRPAPVPPPPPSIPETPAAHQPVPRWPDPAAEASGVGR